MKKSLLLLTGLLALSATAMAADATVEAPTTTAAPAQFKAHGSYSSYLKAYSNKSYNKKQSVHNEIKEPTDKDYYGTKTDQNSKLKLYNYANAYLTENTYVSVEQIDYFNYPGYDRSRSAETVVDFNHSSGKIGSTELEFSQNLEFDRYGATDTYEYAPSIDFSSYLGDGNSGTFELDFDHARYDGTTPYKASQSAGYDLDTNWGLGAGFAFEAELSGTFYGRDKGVDSTDNHIKTLKTKNGNTLDLTLSYGHTFYDNGINKINVYADFENVSSLTSEKPNSKKRTHSHGVYLASESYINFSHNVNSATNIYLRPGLLLGKGLDTNGNKDTENDYNRSHAQLYLRAGFSITL